MIHVILDGPPEPKGRPRTFMVGGRPRILTPKKTRLYEDRIRCAAVEAMEGKDMFSEAVSVVVTAYVAPPKALKGQRRIDALDGLLKPLTRPDVDNYAKVIDGLNGIVFKDDNLVTDLIVRKRYSERPRLVITVETESDFA